MALSELTSNQSLPCFDTFMDFLYSQYEKLGQAGHNTLTGSEEEGWMVNSSDDAVLNATDSSFNQRWQ